MEASHSPQGRASRDENPGDAQYGVAERQADIPVVTKKPRLLPCLVCFHLIRGVHIGLSIRKK